MRLGVDGLGEVELGDSFCSPLALSDLFQDNRQMSGIRSDYNVLLQRKDRRDARFSRISISLTLSEHRDSTTLACKSS